MIAQGGVMSVRRRRNAGITEDFWSGLSEDKKFQWKVISKLVTLVGAWLITKTGVAYLDGAIAVGTSLFSFMLIENQRSHTRYSLKMRRWIARASIFLGVWGVFLVGLLYFVEVAIFSLFSSLATSRMPNLEGRYGDVVGFCVIAIVIVASCYAVVKVFRDLDLVGVFYHLPKKQLMRLVVKKRFELQGGVGFMYFELGVIVVTICYSGVSSVLVSAALDIIEVFKAAWVLLDKTPR